MRKQVIVIYDAKGNEVNQLDMMTLKSLKDIENYIPSGGTAKGKVLKH